MHNLCHNCGNSDTNEFIRQEPPRDDYFTCTKCGECDIDLDYFEQQYTEEVLQSGTIINQQNLSTRRSANDNISTYHRRAHLMERLSQSLCREPEIPDNDKQAIQEIYDGWKKFDKTFTQRIGNIQEKLYKRDVQRILRLLNSKEHNMKWTTKYLEKWKSISRFLYKYEHNTEMTLQITENQIIKIGSKFITFSHLWDRLKQEGKFPERKHFPNYNFILTLIAKDLCNIELDPEEFPLPSLKCQQKLIKYYIILAKELNFLTEDTKEKYLKTYSCS